MKNKIVFLSIICLSLVLFTHSSFAQLIKPGLPASFRKSSYEIPVYEMPAFDQAAMEAEDQLNKTFHYGPTRFAKVFDVDIDIFKDGKNYLLPDSSQMWLLSIKSKGAFSINFTFSKFYIPDSARIFIYNKDHSSVFGAITSENNNKNQLLAITPVAGDEIVIEYWQPKKVDNQANLKIKRVGHDYKGIVTPSNNKKLKSAEACEVNINCPEGADWQIDKRAVCRLLITNSEYCSGVLVNNTSFDGTPYVMTANHCISEELQAENTVFLFNYEASTCSGQSSDNNQTMSGAKLIATSPNNRVDFALMKINNTIPKSYQPYLAGWNNVDLPATGAVGIHHPAGDIKKISITNSQLYTDNYGEGYDDGSHWHVPVWSTGATEGGSSGSPLFNLNHQIVGTLTGGASSCSNPVNDYYSKIATAWSNFAPQDEQLKVWLDPINTGETSISGCDPYIPRVQFDLGMKTIDSPSDELCTSDLLQPTVSLQNNGYVDITSFSVKYAVDGGAFTTKGWNGTLISGSVVRMVYPQIQLSVGTHKIQFILEYPNGISDLNANNDTISKSFVVRSGESLNLTIQTDGNGSQNSWTLKDQSNTTLYDASNLSSYSKQNTLFCLNKGCYTFTMNDAGGDGMCCTAGTGYYSLYDNITYTTVAAGARFGAISEVDFCIQTKPFDYDMELYSILSPSGEYCTTSKFKPILVLKNKGNIPLTGAKITCSVDGQFVYDAIWSGNLAQYAKDTLNLEYVKLADGIHKILFSVSRTDGNLEQNTLNDTLSIDVNIETKPATHLEFFTDKYGSEITWKITDDAQNIVYSGGPYLQDSLVVDKRDFCLDPNKCYTYTVHDDGGDGICCGNGFGHFLFYGDTRKDTILYGSKYFYGLSNNACTKTVAAKDFSHYNFKIFPNPADGIVTFETDKIGEYEVWVTNLSGQQMGHFTFNSNISVFNCSDFPSGLYLFRFVGADETRTIKLVVTH